jgi:UDP-N-acetylmuramoylalanine--D-glutamate ligase
MINQICAKLKNKKVLILGFGKEGKSTYQFFRKYFPDMTVGIYDKNEMKENLPNAVIHGGSSYQDILSDYDIIIKSPGIVFHCKNSKDMKKLTSQTDLFLEFYRNQTIGITGTKGKSTTSSLIYHVLKAQIKIRCWLVISEFRYLMFWRK